MIQKHMLGNTYGKKINDDLFIKYYNEGKTDTEIGKLMNLSHSTISIHRNKLKLKPNFIYKSRINEVEFLKLYKEGLNDSQIGRILKISNGCVNEFRKKLSLKLNIKEYRCDLTYTQHQILVGTILGDGHLRKTHVNTSLSFAHCLKQTEYLWYKYNLLKPLFDDHPKERMIGKYPAISLRSGVRDVLNIYFEKYYKNGIKILGDLYNFTPISLAFLFMDDGYKTVSGYAIATNCFPDVEVLQNKLKTYGVLHTRISKNNVLIIKAKSKDIFTSLVYPWIIPCMKYKLHNEAVLFKQGELLKNPDVKQDNQQPSLSSNTFEGSTTNSRIQTDNAEDSNRDTSALPFKTDENGFVTTKYDDFTVMWKPMKGFDY